jgi:ATP-dependent Clp protease ATP-binding subunit ClpC
MNESTLTQLKIIVERAVRPVRASVTSKQKMRAELLAHVVGVFEEENKGGDDQAALARTQERFGHAAELADRLQASVPEVDRLNQVAENLLGYGSGESAVRPARQLAAVVGAACFVALGVMIVIHVLRGHGSEWLTVARVPSLLAPLLMAFWVFCGTLLAHAMQQALFGPAGFSWLRVGLVAAAAWIIISVTTFAVCLVVLADMQTSLWDALSLLPYGVLLPVLLAAVACFVHSECRHAREWESLQID